MAAVVIGVDPAKRSNTIEVIDSDENVLLMARFENSSADYRKMRGLVKRWPERQLAEMDQVPVGHPSVLGGVLAHRRDDDAIGKLQCADGERFKEFGRAHEVQASMVSSKEGTRVAWSTIWAVTGRDRGDGARERMCKACNARKDRAAAVRRVLTSIDRVTRYPCPRS